MDNLIVLFEQNNFKKMLKEVPEQPSTKFDKKLYFIQRATTESLQVECLLLMQLNCAIKEVKFKS